jgi:hypothetical protein
MLYVYSHDWTHLADDQITCPTTATESAGTMQIVALGFELSVSIEDVNAMILAISDIDPAPPSVTMLWAILAAFARKGYPSLEVLDPIADSVLGSEPAFGKQPVAPGRGAGHVTLGRLQGAQIG